MGEVLFASYVGTGLLSAALRNAYIRRRFPMLVGNDRTVDQIEIVAAVIFGWFSLLATLISGQFAWPPTLRVRP